jgi:4-amino-4-deoxy-L-arabinose transferase-like glycosyltransferase
LKRFLNLPTCDWAWLILLFFFRLWIGAHHGLGVDEAHYVLYGVRLDWSYFDHPPLIGWVQAFFLGIFGQHEWVARLPSALSGLLCSVLIYRLCLKISNSEYIARLSTIALNSAFLVAALWMMFLPDTPLLILTIWLVQIIFNLLSREKLRDWAMLGVCLGLCGLTKYTAIFFVISLLLILLTERAWSRIRPLGLLLALFLAVAIVSPVFFWNMHHDWISFNYQKEHVLGHSEIRFERFFVFLLVQLAAFSPFVVVASIYGLIAQRKNRNQYVRIAMWIAGPTFLFFAYSSLHEDVLPHWTLISWGLIIPIGTTLALMHTPKLWVRVCIYITTAITVFIMTELAFPFLPFPDYQSPYADLTGWPELHGEIQNLLQKQKPGSVSLAVSNWTQGSRANYYLSDLAPVFVLDDRFDQFDIWEGGPPKTPDLLILAWRGFPIDAGKSKRCKSIEPIETKVFYMHEKPVNSVELFWCRGYKLN